MKDFFVFYIMTPRFVETILLRRLDNLQQNKKKPKNPKKFDKNTFCGSHCHPLQQTGAETWRG